MMRADLCSSDDYDTMDAVQATLGELGFVAEDTWHDSSFGVGLTRFRRGASELTIYRDAWNVDVAGDDGLVNELLLSLQDR